MRGTPRFVRWDARDRMLKSGWAPSQHQLLERVIGHDVEPEPVVHGGQNVPQQRGSPARDHPRSLRDTLLFAGARILLSGRDATKLERTAAEIGDNTKVVPIDASSPESVTQASSSLADEDITILVNNAGIAGPVLPLWQIQPEDWDEVFAANVRGVYLMCRAVLPSMIAHGSGDIVNVASVSGKRPLARRTPYTASKMAVIGLTTTLAHEVGPLGINVNTLSPGPVEGERMDRNFRLEAERTGQSTEQARHEFVSRAALGRMVTEQEVAAALIAMLNMPGLSGADIDLSAGMIAR